MIPQDLATAIDDLVNSADDDGCDGLVVVGKQQFLYLVNAAKNAGLDVFTHIEEEEEEEVK